MQNIIYKTYYYILGSIFKNILTRNCTSVKRKSNLYSI